MAASYVHGASSTPLLGTTIGGFLDRAVQRWGERPALVVREQNVRLSYAELGAAVERLATALLASGLEPGDRVGIWAPNRSEWVLTQFATARAGLILVNINPAYRTHELEYALNQAGCSMLLLARQHKSLNYLEMLRELAPELAKAEPGALQAQRLPDLRTAVLLDDSPEPGVLDWEALLEAATDAALERVCALGAQLNFDDPINIQFTSGTTGQPKGATLTHHNLLNNGFFVGEAMHLTEQDRLCIPVPFYHCFGMVLGNLACVTHGSCMVIPGAGFDPLTTLETVAAERCTGIMAGSPCPIEVMRRVVNAMHMRDVTIAYGMTETSPVSFQTTPDDPLERRVSTVGRVHPHVEVKIIDAEGHIVPRGTTGELCTRGYSVMLGYWNDELRSRETVDAAGWMHTGDLAVIDTEGYANIVGRIKDMVIRGGENIYPREIEEFLYTHPQILDVQVFGIPDPKYGEELCAWIQLHKDHQLSDEDIRTFCEGRIAHYKIPRHIRFVDSYPLTVTGKVQKFHMRETMMQELGLEVEPTA